MTLNDARNMIAAATSLSGLRDALVDIEAADPELSADYDYSDLPTFGGDEPADLAGIYSWDENSILTWDRRWLIEPRR